MWSMRSMRQQTHTPITQNNIILARWPHQQHTQYITVRNLRVATRARPDRSTIECADCVDRSGFLGDLATFFAFLRFGAPEACPH